jgi:hypothetical protein
LLGNGRDFCEVQPEVMYHRVSLAPGVVDWRCVVRN